MYEVKAFQCPAAFKQARIDFPNLNPQTAQYYVHLATWIAPGVTERAFGYRSGSSTTINPLRLNRVSDPSRSIALIDRDNELFQLFGSSSTGLPHKPVHGKFRNVLFIDGHVESVANERISAELNALKIN